MVKRYTLNVYGKQPWNPGDDGECEYHFAENIPAGRYAIIRESDADDLAERCERLESDALDALNFAFEKEIQRVSHVEYDSNEICRHFFKELRRSFIETLSGSSGGKDG